MTEKEEIVKEPTTSNNEEGFIYDEDELGRALEAVLFAAGYPVEIDKLCRVFSRDKRDMRRFLTSHSLKFNSMGLGIMMLVFDESVQLCTREEYKDYVRQTLGIKMSGKISASSLEVLAIVAYNQPVTKAFIEQVRGVDCSYAISSLSDKGLIEAKDRLDVPGRPLLYSTTEAFLRCFGINDLGELPKVDFKDDDGEKSVDGEQVELVI
jgi:segregation and condensation protein B